MKRRWIPAALVVVAAAIVASVLNLSLRRRGADEEDQAIPAAAAHLSHTKTGEVVLQLGSVAQSRIGLETETLAGALRRNELIAYGAVLDPAPLVALDAELLSAKANLSASRAEFRRARLLHSEGQNVSLKDLQLAEAKFRGDKAQFTLLNQRIADNWGERVAGMDAKRREALIAALVKRTAAIIRVTVPPGETISRKPDRALVMLLGYESHPLASNAISYAPTVDRSLQGQTFLLQVEASEFPLRPGAAATARLQLPGAPQHGVVLPRAAVVRGAGKAWAYVQIAPERFARREVATGWPTADGWFVTSGFAPGDRVVIVGAQTLLSEEFQSLIQSHD
jgi:hypothetical protein